MERGLRGSFEWQEIPEMFSVLSATTSGPAKVVKGNCVCDTHNTASFFLSFFLFSFFLSLLVAFPLHYSFFSSLSLSLSLSLIPPQHTLPHMHTHPHTLTPTHTHTHTHTYINMSYTNPLSAARCPERGRPTCPFT